MRLPGWLRQDIPDTDVFRTQSLVSGSGAHTVCREAHCPNLTDCFSKKKAAFLILGDVCTRSCSFCAVKKSGNFALGVDGSEPRKVARLAHELGLGYCVITSVTRDDLADGGAGQFVNVVSALRASDKELKIELLIPDFLGNPESLRQVAEAKPEVIAHNLETVERLYLEVRPQADYRRSLGVLKTVKEFDSRIVTKSSLMLGMGEEREEVLAAMKDLRQASCDCLTLGQYLAPSKAHYPVKEFIPPGIFEQYRMAGLEMGFKAVFCGPKVRSSYMAEDLFLSLKLNTYD